MVKIPTPAERGQPVGSVDTVAAQTPFQNIRPADTGSAFARDASQLGAAMQNVGQILNQKREDALTREAEVAYMEFEREINDPQTGIFTRRGGAAMGVTDEVTERFSKRREEIMQRASGLSGSSRQAVEEYLMGAEQRLWKRAASHELQETQAHERVLVEAQIEGQIDRASSLYSMPEEVGAALLQVESLAGDLADQQGLQGEAREQFIQSQVSSAHGRVATQMMNTGNAVGAQAYLEAALADGSMDPTDAQDMLSVVRPEAIKQQGNELARAIFNGTPASAAGGTKGATPRTAFIDRMIQSESSGRAGVQRTNQDGRSFVGLGQVGAARLQDMKNAGVVPQGMSLAEFGTAANEDLQRKALEWHFQDIDNFIERNGYLNKGWSLDGLRAVAHLGGKGGLDRFVMSGGEYNPGDELGTTLKDYYDKFAGSVNQVSDIEDPAIRAAAAAELERLQAAEYKRFNRVQGQAMNQIYADMDAAFAAGQDFDLDAYLAQPGVREVVGDQVDSLRNYFEQLGQVDTVQDVYDGLQVMSEASPQQFASEQLWKYRDKLSQADYKAFVDKQAKILGDNAEGNVAGRVTITELRRHIGPYATGLDTQQRGFVEQRTQQFVDSWSELNGGNAPPPELIQAQAERLALEFNNPDATGIIAEFDDPWGSPTDLQGILAEADANGLQVLFEETDLAFNVPGPAGTTVEVSVTGDEMRNFASNYEITTGRAPSPSQLIQMLYLVKAGLVP